MENPRFHRGRLRDPFHRQGDHLDGDMERIVDEEKGLEEKLGRPVEEKVIAAISAAVAQMYAAARG